MRTKTDAVPRTLPVTELNLRTNRTQTSRSSAAGARRRAAPAVVIVPWLVALSAFSQWQVNNRVAGGISGMGSVRYIQSSSQLLPSEARFSVQSAGMLPSENRLRYLDAGPGTSYSRVDLSTPGYRVPTPFDSQSSVRYGSSNPYDYPRRLPGQPVAGVVSAPRSVNTVPGSIRYGGQYATPIPNNASSNLMRPIGAPAPLYRAPGSIRYGAGLR